MYTLAEVKAKAREYQISIRANDYNELVLRYSGAFKRYDTEDSVAFVDLGHTGESRQEAYEEALNGALRMYEWAMNQERGDEQDNFTRMEDSQARAHFKVTDKMDHTNWEELLHAK